MLNILKKIGNAIINARKAQAEREIRNYFQTEYGRDYRNYVKAYGKEPTIMEISSIVGRKFND